MTTTAPSQTSSAGELRRAAEKLRGLATRATPGPWGVGNGTDIASEVEQLSRGSFSYRHKIASLDDMDYDPDYVAPRANLATEEDDAAYIAAMDPRLAVALVDALIQAADMEDSYGHHNNQPLEEIARLINGPTDSETEK